MGLRWLVPSMRPRAPCNNTKQIQKDPYDSKGYTHTSDLGRMAVLHVVKPLLEPVDLAVQLSPHL